MTLLAPIMMRSGFMNVKKIIETAIENIRLKIKLCIAALFADALFSAPI